MSIKFITLLTLVIFISGCAPKASELVKLQESSLEQRQLETKAYDTLEEDKILTAGVYALQDMGFNIDEINRDLGVVTCSKTRDAREIGQQVGYFMLALFAGANAMDLADHTQMIKATLVTTPKSNMKKQTVVRLTMMRIIKNQKGNVIKIESIKDQPVYDQFFDKLSKSVFLEEQKI